MTPPRWLQRRPSEAEIGRELRDHIQLEAEELMRRGMSPRDAQLEARRRFGNVASLQESTRESWGSLWLERLGQDLRFGLRMLARAPVFTTVAALCLALGIGGEAAIQSWTEGIVHHPFPGVRDQQRLVAVAGTANGTPGYDEMSWLDFMDLSRGTTAFESFFVSKITGATWTGGDRAERLVGQLVSANYFDAIGVRPMLGRGFVPGEDVGQGAHPVVVISYRLWRDRFAANPSIVGTTLRFNGIPHTIIGVTPERFLGTFVGYAMQFWVPASQQAVFDASGYKLNDRTARWVEGFARLAPGVSLATAEAQIAVAAQRLASAFPNEDRGRGVRVFPLSQNPFDNAKTVEPMLRVGSIVAMLVLLIVSSNIANLLLVRAIARQSELTVRRALGAGRARLIRQLVTEGVILAVIGTLAGLALAYLSRNVLGFLFAPRGGVRLVFAAEFDWRVVLLTAGMGVGATIVFALLPALQATQLDLASGIRAAAAGSVGGAPRGRLRASLVLVQVSSSVVLLAAAGLMMRSMSGLLNVNPGFVTSEVTTTTINLFAAGYDTARAHRFEDELLRRVRAIPGVSGAALSRSLPFSTRPYDNGPILVDGYAPARDEQPTADYNPVTPGYFATNGIPLLAGREFEIADADTSAPVAIVSRAMAERYWPNASPIGKRLQLRGRWRRVVGVAGDIEYRSLTERPGMLFYIPLAQQPSAAVDLYLRAPAAIGTTVAPRVVAAIHAIDPNVSPYEFLTMREQVNRSTAGEQIVVMLLVLFGGVAVFLAAIGLYGVISYMVSQSTRELGLRMALGARPSQLMALVISSGLRLTLLGIGVGLLLALATTRLLGDLLFRVTPRDPLVLGGVAAIMIVAAVAACVLPAWRASRLDPVRALRV